MSDAATLMVLAVLLVVIGSSAFFSGAETILFALTAQDRWQIERDHPEASARIDKLLAHPRQLLLTLLMANMAVNSIWFAVGTVALADAHFPMWATVAIGIAQVILLIALGEVIPKIVGNMMRVQLAPLVSGPTLFVCRVLAPLRALVERVVFDALNAVSRESLADARTTAEEVGEAVRSAGTDAGLGQDESTVLGRLVMLKRKRVRDVMTPRRQLVSVPRSARRDEITQASARQRLKRLPVVDRNLDTIVGILDVRSYLLDLRGAATPIEAHVRPVQYIPEIASLDQLLDLFRSRQCSLMVVVDEHGGTAGMVALEDAVEEVVGDIAAQGEAGPADPLRLEDGSWRIDGEMPADAFCAHFRLSVGLTHASTVAGIVIEVLGDLPEEGEAFDFGAVRVEITRTGGGRATEVNVRTLEGKTRSRGRRP